MTRHGLRPLWLGAACVVAVAAGVIVWSLDWPLPKILPQIGGRTPDAAHGAYLAVLGDCTACHTKPGGAEFAGGTPFKLPMGVVYASNITPDSKHGIGKYDLRAFVRLMREGVARDGRQIYPAMPYTSFTKLSDADLQDLYAYFEHDVRPSAQPSRRADIAWPLSMRWPLGLWNKAFLDNKRFVPDGAKSAVWNRGAYIVEGLGHCGTCHTPRGLALEEKATKDDLPLYLSGAVLAGQSSSNLRDNAPAGLHDWTADDIVEMLRTARTAHAVVAGQMAEVVAHSTQAMHEDDVRAIAVYLKSLSPAPDQTSRFAPSGTTYQTIMAGRDVEAGGRMFMDSCSACHRLDGQGANYAFPSLAGNATVLHESPDSLVSAIVAGARRPSTQGSPSPLAMPAFGWRYSDAQIAQLASYVRSAWGNHASRVSAAQVAQIRAITASPDVQR